MEIEPMWTAAFLMTALDFGPAKKGDMALVPFVTKKKSVFQMLHLSISLQHQQLKA